MSGERYTSNNRTLLFPFVRQLSRYAARHMSAKLRTTGELNDIRNMVFCLVFAIIYDSPLSIVIRHIVKVHLEEVGAVLKNPHGRREWYCDKIIEHIFPGG